MITFLSQRNFLIPFFSLWLTYGCYQLFYSQTEMIMHINANWNPVGDTGFPVITYLGDGWFSIGAGLLMLLFSLGSGLCIILSYALSGIFVQLLKRFVFVDFYRPPKVLTSVLPSLHKVPHIELYQFGSFPSGHTTSHLHYFRSLTLLQKVALPNQLYFCLRSL